LEALYFIAVVPPEDIREKVKGIKEYIAENYNSNHALRSPAHITLHMPFKWKEKKLELLINELTASVRHKTPFKIKLKGYDSFAPRVIFIDVEESDRLYELKTSVERAMKNLHILNIDYKEKPFHPHMTVAFRDLRKAKFWEAWKEFESRDFEEEFDTESIVLLKHNGKIWEVFQEFEFNVHRK
jgi:2'-5' RNA ligase